MDDRALLPRPHAEASAPSPTSADAAGCNGLPRPVRRYLARVLPSRDARTDSARLAHAGDFDMSPSKPQWRRFESRQWMAAARPGFLWDARIAATPGMPIQVVDRYVAGVGALSARLWGLLPLARAGGTPALNRGELMRWLAEAVYVPWAFVACPGLSWHEVDDRRSDARLVDGDTAVVLRFSFGDDDLVATVAAEARPRLVGRNTIETPWTGSWSDYRRIDGVLVPTRGEVAWRIDGKSRPYWRGELLSYQRVPCAESGGMRA